MANNNNTRDIMYNSNTVDYWLYSCDCLQLGRLVHTVRVHLLVLKAGCYFEIFHPTWHRTLRGCVTRCQDWYNIVTVYNMRANPNPNHNPNTYSQTVSNRVIVQATASQTIYSPACAYYILLIYFYSGPWESSWFCVCFVGGGAKHSFSEICVNITIQNFLSHLEPSIKIEEHSEFACLQSILKDF